MELIRNEALGHDTPMIFKHISEETAADIQSPQALLIQNAVRQAIDACLESTGFHDLYYNFELGCFVINHPDMGEMIVDDLSDGFRSILSMVADLSYRMVRLNPQICWTHFPKIQLSSCAPCWDLGCSPQQWRPAPALPGVPPKRSWP